MGFISFRWIIDVSGPNGTLYEGENFQLKFKFSNKYPFDSPIVTFTGDCIPLHPHIYSNGHICLSILTTDWTPAMSVESVCLSIISMLASAKQKVSNFIMNLKYICCYIQIAAKIEAKTLDELPYKLK